MKKIALVSANQYKVPYPVYPLGISYITTYLGIHLPEYEIRLFDFNFGGYEDFAKFLRSEEFELVGISLRNIDDTNIFDKNCFVTHYKELMKTARATTDVPIVIGGPGFSVYPELVFNELNPDFAICGEGEESIRQLIVALSGGGLQSTDTQALPKQPSRISRKLLGGAGNQELTGPHPEELPESITSIDGLAYRSADGKLHINGKKTYISSPQLHVDDEWAAYYWDKSGMLNIQTKRGCPYSCIYCSYPNVDGRKVRTLDTKTVVANIEELYYKKGISYLFFTDSIFNIHNDYNRELAHRIIESGVKINWGAYFSPKDLSHEDLELYQKSGLTHIEFGTDSFSDAQLEHYDKKFRFEDIKRTSLDASNLGIFYAHFLILCGFGETDQTLDETFEHSKEVGFTVIFPYIGMRIYPNTKLCQIALQEGMIKDTNELINPTYYVSKQTDINTLKERATATGVKWIFPNDPMPPSMERFRMKKKRGPLWEFLRY